MGIECWGSYDDLQQLYDFIANFWGDELLGSLEGGISRNKILSWFCYDLRKGFQGGRLTASTSPVSKEKIPYFGFQASWPHVLFSVAALEFNMQYKQPSKLEMGLLLQLKYLLEEAMKAYDPVTAIKLLPFLTDISRDNKYLYHFCRRAVIDYFKLGGGKQHFRELPLILEAGLSYSSLFSVWYKEAETAKLTFGSDDFDWNEDDAIYEVIW